MYCFQRITDKDAEVPIIRIVFLIFFLTVVITHMYTYCYSAERLITEVNRRIVLQRIYYLRLCCWYNVHWINLQPRWKFIFQSIGIAYGVYESKWYDIPPKDARNLMIIVYRSTIPLRLTAGKFATFSMEMFGAVRYLRENTLFCTLYSSCIKIFIC